jgi:hypothetical protein
VNWRGLNEMQEELSMEARNRFMYKELWVEGRGTPRFRAVGVFGKGMNGVQVVESNRGVAW